jgi:hypothetical protein
MPMAVISGASLGLLRQRPVGDLLDDEVQRPQDHA